MERNLFAFIVTSEMDGTQYRHAVEGADLADAASAAMLRLPRRVGAAARITRIEVLTELLGAAPAPVEPALAAPEALHESMATQGGTPSTSQSTGGQTRPERLLAMLREAGQPIHVAQIAREFGIPAKRADRVIASLVRAGRARRLPGRSGKVELAGSRGPEKKPAAPSPAGPAGQAPEPRAIAQPAGAAEGGTRVDRLIALLRTGGGRLHIGEIAWAMSISRTNADNVVALAAKAGLARREPGKTGNVYLVGVPAPVPAVATPGPAGQRAVRPGPKPAKIDALVAFLRGRGGPVHITEIARALQTAVGAADNLVARATRMGLTRRIGNRSGLVVLAAPAPGVPHMDAGPGVAAPPSPVEAAAADPGVAGAQAPSRASDGGNTGASVREEAATPLAAPGAGSADMAGSFGDVENRVRAALVTLGDWASAREVAGIVGCRPREAGNALALLARAGVLDRRDGDREAGQAALYRATGGA